MRNFQEGWYLVYTKPRHEKKVQTRLAEKEVRSFLPMRKILRTWHDRKKYVDEPCFPSYVFIYLDDGQKYYEGLDTEGVLYYVKTGKETARVSDAIVNNIKLVSGRAGDMEVSDRYFQPGRQLIITEGALAGLSCEVVELNRKQKLLVRVDLLQRNLLLTLPVGQLMPASQSVAI